MTLALRPSERRAFGRRESSIHAMARLGGRTPEPCIVRDFSDGGARLEFAADVELPARFRLVIEAKGFDAECEVRRQEGRMVGVRFIQDDAGRAIDRVAAAAGAGDAAPAEPAPRRLPETWRNLTVVSGDDVRRKLLSGR